MFKCLRHSDIRIFPKSEFWFYHLLAKRSRVSYLTFVHEWNLTELVIWLNNTYVPASIVPRVVNCGSHRIVHLKSPFNRTYYGERSWLTTFRCYTFESSRGSPQVMLPLGCSSHCLNAARLLEPSHSLQIRDSSKRKLSQRLPISLAATFLETCCSLMLFLPNPAFPFSFHRIRHVLMSKGSP